MDKQTKSLINSYSNISKVLLAKKIIKTKYFTTTLSKVKSEYFSITTPNTTNPQQFNIEQVESIYQQDKQKPSIYLFERHQKLGFIEHLVKKGYQLDSKESWMVYLNKRALKVNNKVEVRELNKDDFRDFYEVVSQAFIDFDANESYQKLVKKSLGNIKNNIYKDLQSKIFVIYEKSKPVSAGGLIFSPTHNFAYLHNAGTIKNYRGKGLQTALIKHRVSIALKNNITNIYSLVDEGGQSWRNMINSNFYQKQVGYIFIKPNEYKKN